MINKSVFIHGAISVILILTAAMQLYHLVEARALLTDYKITYKSITTEISKNTGQIESLQEQIAEH